MHLCSLEIGNLHLRLHTPHPVRIAPEFSPFLSPEGPPDIQADYEEDPAVSGVCPEISPDGKHVLVRYAPGMADRFGALRGCLIELPMEELLLKHHRFFLHASLVTSPWGGILFSGDCGVGKSTQAGLWQTHRGSRLINGDRAILEKGHPWRAHGSPYVGSSACYVRESVPVRAIVFLSQGPAPVITPLSPGDGFRRLLLQSSMERTSPESVDALCDLLTDLVSTVPLYHMTATMDRSSVDALARVLEKGT